MMLIRFAALCGALLLAVQTMAQNNEDAVPAVALGSLPSDYKTRVFGDKINVRNAPSKNAASVGQLSAGDMVTITEADTTRMKLNGWETTWNKISFLKNGKSGEGYVWGGLLSPITLEGNNVTFVYNITQSSIIKEKDEANEVEYEIERQEMEVRALRNGKIISSATFAVNIDFSYETSALLSDNRGLPGYQNILQIQLYYPACGYVQYDLFCLWDGNTLTPLPALTSAADAGAFHESESYTFPNEEKGIPDAIIYSYELGEGMEDTGEYDYTLHLRPMLRAGNTFKKPEINPNGK